MAGHHIPEKITTPTPHPSHVSNPNQHAKKENKRTHRIGFLSSPFELFLPAESPLAQFHHDETCCLRLEVIHNADNKRTINLHGIQGFLFPLNLDHVSISTPHCLCNTLPHIEFPRGQMADSVDLSKCSASQTYFFFVCADE